MTKTNPLFEQKGRPISSKYGLGIIGILFIIILSSVVLSYTNQIQEWSDGTMLYNLTFYNPGTFYFNLTIPSVYVNSFEFTIGPEEGYVNETKSKYAYWNFETVNNPLIDIWHGRNITHNDSSIYANYFNESTPQFLSGRDGGTYSYQFNKHSGYINMSVPVNGQSFDLDGLLCEQDATFSMWLNVNDTSACTTQRQVIMTLANSGYLNIECNQDDTLRIFSDIDKSSKNFVFTYYGNKWVHLAVVLKGNQFRYYVNGTFRQGWTINPSGACDTTDGPDILGAHPTTRNFPYTGLMDEFKIIGKGMTDEEVMALYQGYEFDFVNVSSVELYPTFTIYNESSDINETTTIDGNATEINRALELQCNFSGIAYRAPYCYFPLSLNVEKAGRVLLNISSGINYSFGIDNCNNSFNIPSNATTLNVTFYTLDNNLTTVDRSSHYIDVLTPIYTNFSTTYTDITTYDMCIYPGWAEVQADMLISYANGTTPYEYSTYNTTLNNITHVYNLYITEGTSQVILTVVDLNDDPVEGALIKILRFDVGTGIYTTTEVLETDANGQTIANLVLITDFYKFIVEYEGAVRLIEPNSGGVRVLSTTKTFRINLGEADWYDLYDTTIDVYTDLIFNNGTNSFIYTWSDPNSDMHYGCLKVIKRNITGDYLIDDNCVESTAGSIVIPITAIQNGSSFHATGYLKFDEPFVTDELVEIFKDLFDFSKIPGSDQMGLYMSFFLILGLTLVGLPFPAIALPLMGVGFIATTLLGLYKIGGGLVVGIIILIIIQLYKMGSR